MSLVGDGTDQGVGLPISSEEPALFFCKSVKNLPPKMRFTAFQSCNAAMQLSYHCPVHHITNSRPVRSEFFFNFHKLKASSGIL